MDTPDNNPLCGPWTCADGVTVRDCDDKIVAVLARGGEGDGMRCRAIANTPRALALLTELVDIEGAQPGTHAWASKVHTLLKDIEA